MTLGGSSSLSGYMTPNARRSDLELFAIRVSLEGPHIPVHDDDNDDSVLLLPSVIKTVFGFFLLSVEARSKTLARGKEIIAT